VTNNGPSNQHNGGLQLSQRVIFIALAQASIGLAALSKSLLLTRWLDHLTYGTYLQILMVAQAVPPFLNLGLPDGIFYFASPAAPAQRRKLITRYYGLALGAGVVVILAAVGLRAKIAGWMNNPELLTYAWLMGLYTVGYLLDGLAIPTLVVTDRANALAAVSIAHMLYEVGAVGAAWIADASLAVVISLGIVGLIAKTVVVVSLVVMRGGQKATEGRNSETAPALPATSRQLAYCLPLAFAAGCNWLSRSAARFIVAGLYPPDKFAVFARGAFEVPFVGMAATAITQGIFPNLVVLAQEQKNDQFVRLWQSALRRSALIVFPLAALIAVVSRQLIVLLFSEKYAESVPIFQVFIVLLPVRIAVYSHVLRALGLSYHVLVASAVGLISNTVLSWSLCQGLSLEGAAWGTVVGEMLTVGLILGIISRKLAVSLTALMPWGKLIHLVLVLTGPTAVAVVVNLLLGQTTYAIFPVGGVFAVAYYVVGRRSGAINDRDVQLVGQWVGWVRPGRRRPSP